MALNFRQSQIIDFLRSEGTATVDELAEHFDVALQTIRRDLTELAQQNKIERVHGGAMLPSNSSYIGYEARQSLNTKSKFEIARAIAKRIPNDCAIFLNIGTTIEAVAQSMLHHQNLLIVTNNMNVARILAPNPSIKIVVTGGELRPHDGGLTGKLTRDCVERYKFDFGIIGCSSIDNYGDLMEFDIDEADVTQSIIRKSRKVFLAADHSKFLRSAPVKICSLEDLDCFFTDRELSKDLAGYCKEWGTEIVVT